MERLTELAEKHGIKIRWHKHGLKGIWQPEHHAISLKYGMSPEQEISTLAHELGHAFYGHPGGCPKHLEDKADWFAADLLITQEAYERAERLYPGDIGRIANDLGVTTHLVEVWRKNYHIKFSA